MVGTIFASAMLAASAAPAVARTVVARVAQVGPAPAAQGLQLVLPLAADTSGLERYASSITTPGSANYGRYVTLVQLERMFGASGATRARVIHFLRAAGATHVAIPTPGLFADATITVARAERAFGTALAQFRGAHGAHFIAPSGAAAASVGHVPAGLRGAARGVIGLDTRPLYWPSVDPIAHGASGGVPSIFPHTGTTSGCSAAASTEGFTPNQYLSAYDFSPLENRDTGQGQTVALIEIDGFKDRDINAFAHCFGLRVPALRTYGVGSVHHTLPAGGEATLDLEVLDAAAQGLKEIDIYEANSDAESTLRAMTAPLGNTHHLPQVVSASLGLCEQDVHAALGSSGIGNIEASLAAASATGITYLASSGDDGSADCLDQNGNPIHRLAVNYPASSWWVTGVGGTNFELNAANQITQQVVWNDGSIQPGSAGGGGLSTEFGRPSYQNGTESSNRRAVPDVSMLADVAPGYAIYCSVGPPDCDPSNPWTTVGGTSAATPLLAGGFALVDEQLHAAGKVALGLVNPLLYTLGRNPAQAASVFSDVQVGDNDVFPFFHGLGALGCCSASAGFDDASGWGSVNVASFSQAAVSSAPAPVRVSLSLPRGQHPLSTHVITATVSCSAACLTGAFALVTIGNAKPFEVDSRVANLSSAASATVTMHFSHKQIGKLNSGRRHGKHIKATVVGVLFNNTVYSVIGVPGESVQSRTGGKKLAL
jgi:kumamolisin